MNEVKEGENMVHEFGSVKSFVRFICFVKRNNDKDVGERKKQRRELV